MLHIFGDSHTQILSGASLKQNDSQPKFKSIKSHWFHGALAWNLMDNDYKIGKWGEKIFEALHASDDVTAIMLVFGEIDIRAHVIKRAFLNNQPPLVNAYEVCDRLFSFAQILKKSFSQPVFILSPIPSAPDFASKTNVPVLFSNKERNYITYCFGERLKSLIQNTPGIFMVDIFDELVDSVLNTRGEYYEDGMHLNYSGLNVFIKKFRQLVSLEKLLLLDYYNPNQLKYSDVFFEKDISSKCKIVKYSSSIDKSTSLAYNKKRNITYQSLNEQSPYILIDIGYMPFISKILLKIQNSGVSSEMFFLGLFKSPRDEAFIELKPSRIVDNNEFSILEFICDYNCSNSRFIKIQLLTYGVLSVIDIKIFSKCFFED